MTERKAPRLPSRIRTFFSGGEVEGEGEARDLSKMGCRIASDTVPAIGHELEIQLFSKDFSWPLKIGTAIVRWVGSDSFGVEFLALGSAQRERLRQLIAGQKHLGMERRSTISQ